MAHSFSYRELLDKNRQYLWNPFTQMKGYLEEEPLIIQRGRGIKLIDVNGKEYYDGNSSLWVNPLGHHRAELNEAICNQLEEIAHSTLLGSANPPAILLAERLIQLSPESLQKVFFSNGGAESVEVALKMAFLYWKKQGILGKDQFIRMQNAYHGDTLGAVSVGGIDLFHTTFDPLLFHTEQIPYPYPYHFDGTPEECSVYCLSALKQLLQEKASSIAALIVEPMVQGAGGIIVMPKGFLSGVAALCKEYDVLLIADEVATGFGRTGPMFACEHEGVQPDLMVVGKMLTGGYLPISATLTSNSVYDAFYGDYAEGKTFFHGHSYAGNPLGCAVALANLDLYEASDLLSSVQQLSQEIQPELEKIQDLPHVGEVRQLGFMMGIELVKEKENKIPYDPALRMGAKVCQQIRELGMLTRPLGDVVTILPPLVSTREELQSMLHIVHQATHEVTEEIGQATIR